MNTDSYYEIGSSHKICEDYALHGMVNDTLAYAIVCDGCSSSDRVDVGARLIAHQAERFILNTMKDADGLPYTIQAKKEFEIFRNTLAVVAITTADVTGKSLNLDDTALDATLIVALMDKRMDGIVFVFGDGHAIYQYEMDGSTRKDIYSVEYDMGAPAYISYVHNPFRAKNYMEQFGEQIVSVSTGSLVKENSPMNVDAKKIEDLDDVYAFTSIPLFCVDRVTICSDGIQTYRHNNTHEAVDEELMAKRITDFKNTKGEFVTRRMNRLKRDLVKENVSHLDDVAVASISRD